MSDGKILPVQVWRAYKAHFGQVMPVSMSFPDAMRRLAESLGVIEASRLMTRQSKAPRKGLRDE